MTQQESERYWEKRWLCRAVFAVSDLGRNAPAFGLFLSDPALLCLCQRVAPLPLASFSAVAGSRDI